MDRKRILGQFFTKADLWLKPQVIDFIKNSKCSIAYDPFAGGGDLLKSAVEKCDNINEAEGLDIDDKLNWKINDSLISIPHLENAIIITNPPYISNYSAARKKIDADLRKYFDNSYYSDLYLIALERMLSAQKFVVAIIPETFINSNFAIKNRLKSITILEENPFEDTDTPVIVACFDGKNKDFSEIKVYKNEKFVSTLARAEQLRLSPSGRTPMSFNNKSGWLAVRCVDTTNPAVMISFDLKERMKYDWENRIKVSSRLLTLIEIDVPEPKREEFIAECNSILLKAREESGDIILSPFKGNMKDGRRRRRLDFRACRAIIELAHNKVNNKENKNVAKQQILL